MRNIFSDSNYREQLQYKSLVLLIENQISVLRTNQYCGNYKKKLRIELQAIELLDIYAHSLYVYLIDKVGLNTVQALNEVYSITEQVNNLPNHKHTSIILEITPINLSVEDKVEKEVGANDDAVYFAISELYNVLNGVLDKNRYLADKGTELLLSEIYKFNEKNFKK